MPAALVPQVLTPGGACTHLQAQSLGLVRGLGLSVVSLTLRCGIVSTLNSHLIGTD